MRDLLETLASPRLVATVFVLLGLGLVTGTVVESFVGPEAAARVVYHGWWLFGLLELFGACIVASVITLYPWNLKRAGFAVTHIAIALILAGATLTFQRGVEGEVLIWKGESSNEVVKRDAQGNVTRHTTLPFAIGLQEFTIDRYPGSDQPSGYRSDVRILHADGAASDASIWMNHELSLLDWQFYQSRYLVDGDRVATVLLASRDPGRPLVFMGYALLLVGLCAVLATRAVQARKKAATQRAAVPPRNERYALVLGLAVALVASATYLAGTVPQSHSTVIENLRRIPVQHDGRVMPLDTLAREAVRRVNGKITVHTNDPVMTFLSWLQEPATSYSAPVVREMPRCIPPTDGNGAWSAPAWTGLHEWAALARGPRLTGWPPAALIEQEVKYNRTEPVRLAWILFALAFAHTGLASLRRSKVLDRFAITSLIAGFGSLTWGIATRWQIAGRIPASNMYESLLFLAWGVGLVALLLLPWMRHRLVLLNASGLAALTLALADLLPIDPFIHPVPPVLAGTPWLAIHVPIIMLSYSMFALSVVVAHLQLGITIWAPRRQEAIENASRVLYWYIHVGCFLLTAGIITGSVWAASSWGRYWGWDPKEVWSLVALLAYLAVLHAWRERLLHRFALAAVSILAFQTIVMTYLGVNFILVNGLHSYAMGTSPVARWMFLVATLELAFLFYAVLARKSRMRRELRVS